MCDKCNALLNAPKDTKALVVLYDLSSDAYDVTCFNGIMEIDHERDGTPYAFINNRVVIKSTDRCYSHSIPIKYCPFCGEKLI